MKTYIIHLRSNKYDWIEIKAKNKKEARKLVLKKITKGKYKYMSIVSILEEQRCRRKNIRK